MKTDYTEKVWEHSKSKGIDLLLLLALAEQADRAGRGVWKGSNTESVHCLHEPHTITTMCRSTKAAIDQASNRLIKSGELEVNRVQDTPYTYYQILPNLELNDGERGLPLLEDVLMTLAEWQEFDSTVRNEFPVD